MIYRYRCSTCEIIFEIERSVKDEEIIPSCKEGHEVKRIYSVPEFYVAEHWNTLSKKSLQRKVKYYPGI